MSRVDELTMLTVTVLLSLWICSVCATDSSLNSESSYTDSREQGPRWAPQEIRIDDMLRKHFLKSRMKNSVPSGTASHAHAHAQRNAEEMEGVDLQYGRQEAKRTLRTMRSEMLELAKQRLTGQHAKRPADVHPLEMGMGRSTSSMAWDTLAGILADEYTRQEHPKPSHELRFIGK